MIQETILFAVILLFVYIIHYCWRSLPLINGTAAKYMCASVFTGDRREEEERKEVYGPFPMKYATVTVNYNDLSVSASMFGFIQRKAIYRQGLGATLINDFTEEQVCAQKFNLATPPDVNQDNIPWPMGDKIDDDSFPLNINQTLMHDAINSLFIERNPAKPIRTRAVVVLYDGKLIAERYAPGFSRFSKLVGWSMTKSIISALVGILVDDKKLNIEEPAPVPEWNNTNDPRHSITTKHLLQQTSGLKFKENYTSESDVLSMLFETGDMAAFTASHRLKNKTGTQFSYSSGNTNLLSRIIRHIVGENEYHSFPYRKLFYKLGMNSFIMEVDASGTFVGSSYSWGTARDWARFGLLYLNNGLYNNEQILSEDWIKQTITPSDANDDGHYGFQFWLNKPKNNDSSTRQFPDAPTDMFYADGYEGQNVFIIQSKKLVVVRLGVTGGAEQGYGANDFLKALIASID